MLNFVEFKTSIGVDCGIKYFHSDRLPLANMPDVPSAFCLSISETKIVSGFNSELIFSEQGLC